MADDRLVNSFEKASQEYFKETWEFAWTLAGVATLLVMVGFGIYFSQVALAFIIGGTGLMLYFTWCASIAISALEVGGIKLLGNTGRSMSIEVSNRAEHQLAYYFTIGLFIFDIFTNWMGLYVLATEVAGGVKPGIGGWIVIVFFGSLMAISEILVGWMIRATATSYTSYIQAKQKYGIYKASLLKSVSSTTYDDDKPYQKASYNQSTYIPPKQQPYKK